MKEEKLLPHCRLLESRLGCGLTDYGIQVRMGTEVASVPHITTVQEDALGLLAAIRRGGVTPVSLRDIVEDWLLR